MGTRQMSEAKFLLVNLFYSFNQLILSIQFNSTLFPHKQYIKIQNNKNLMEE